MEDILNLSGKRTTPEQKDKGVIEPTNRELVQDLLIFKEIPNSRKIQKTIDKLLSIARRERVRVVMLGGNPSFLIAPLEKAFNDSGYIVCYPFFKNVKMDDELPHGTTISCLVSKCVGLYYSQTF